MAHLFKVSVTLQDGKLLRGFGFFLDNGEALEQMWAEFPEACSVAAIQLTGRAAS
jgi:hypothetical protein